MSQKGQFTDVFNKCKNDIDGNSLCMYHERKVSLKCHTRSGCGHFLSPPKCLLHVQRLPRVKGNQTKDASWPETRKGVNIFHLNASFGASIKVCTEEVLVLFFCFKFELLTVQPCWYLFTSEEQKKAGL